MSMRVFLDTEFTNFMSPRLLSLGLVADSLEPRELYAEIDLQTEEGRRRLKASTEFVHGTVLTQWGRVANAECSEYELGARAGRWLLCLVAEHAQRIEIVYDYSVDAGLLESALQVSGFLERLKPLLQWTIVSYLNGHEDVEAAKQASWRHSRDVDRLKEHHALADARALRAGFIAMNGAAPQPPGPPLGPPQHSDTPVGR